MRRVTAYGLAGGAIEHRVHVPIQEGLRYIARWKPEDEENIHAMVSVPVPSVIYMLNKIDELTEERDRLRDTLENARMG